MTRRKVLIVVMLILSMLLQCIMPLAMVYATDETSGTGSVAITLNSKLYAAVKADLQRQGFAADYKDANCIIVISKTELESVRSLDLSNGEISDLLGLDAFSNLTELNLHANKLTAESNLNVLDNLSLVKLDLSSNNLESVKTISTFKDIPQADITDQRYTGRTIITVDASEETQQRSTTVEVELPDILLEDGNRIKASWIDRTVYKYQEGGPEVVWAESIPEGSTKLVIKVADGQGSAYKARKGLVRVDVNVNEKTSKLANTQMTFYIAVVDQDETGIAFNDERLYKAVKKQLKQHQTVNEELTEVTNSRDIYSRIYDEALIMVISTDDIINNVPSLVLNNNEIVDLTGLEQFYGLRSYLNLSYNYIEKIDRILELEENKKAKEAEIRTKYEKNLGELKSNVSAYDAKIKEAKQAQEEYNKLDKEYKALKDDDQKAAKLTQMEEQAKKRGDAEEAANRLKALIDKYVQKLYKIYKNEYRLISLLPADVNTLSYEDLFSADVNEIKNYANKTMTRISQIEQLNGLSEYEKWALEKLLTQWGTENSLTFSKQKTVYKVPEGGGDPTPEQENIEFPFTEYFNQVNGDGTLDINDYEQLVYMFKAIDTLSQIEQYSLTRRLLEGNTTDYGAQALKEIKEFLEQQGIDTYFYDLVSYKTSLTGSEVFRTGKTEDTSGFVFDNGSSSFFKIKIGLSSSDYSGSLNGYDKLTLGHRLSVTTSEDITTFIVLPRIQRLNLADNKLETLNGLETLTELKELNVWKNGIHDISSVNWAGFAKLKKLNVGYNQISDIEPLEVLLTLEELDASYNLLGGSFTFNLINMKDLRKADFSHNQYEDIQYAHDQFILKAKGYDEDGDTFADNLTVPEYLKASGTIISFQYQELEMDVTVIKTDEQFVYLDLPIIFKQLKQMDYEHTSFGIDSAQGLVDATGETVKLAVPGGEGFYTSKVSVEGRTGYEGAAAYSTDGIGYGTVCYIYYNVVNSSILPDEQIDPNRPNNPGGETEPGGTTTDPGAPTTYGYEVSGDYVVVYKPKTTIVEFASKFVDTSKYKVTVKNNNNQNRLATGAVVTVTNIAGDKQYAIFEAVVKGDINGDGDIDALDSGMIREVIADTRSLTGSYRSAADVNSDNDIDSQDSMLILQYRADRISSFEK